MQKKQAIFHLNQFKQFTVLSGSEGMTQLRRAYKKLKRKHEGGGKVTNGLKII